MFNFFLQSILTAVTIFAIVCNVVKNGKRETTSFTVEVDEGVRHDTTIEALSKLRPAFKKNGVVTAGNSSQTSDGAAFTLVVSEEIVNKLNLKPIAKMLSCAVGGVDPLYMGIGQCVAIPKALKQAGIKKNDLECNFDYLNFPLSLGKFINFN